MADELGAVRRTPRPTGDRQTPETAAQLPRGATNAPTSVSTDAGNGTDDLRAKFLDTFLRVTRDTADGAVMAERFIAEGWRPAQPSEGPLAVHFAAPYVVIGGRCRQLCMWCGHVLVDVPAEAPLAPHLPWPAGSVVKIEDGYASQVPYPEGDALPPGCCALPDDEPPTSGPGCYPPADGWDGASTADVPVDPVDGYPVDLCGKHTGNCSNRCLLPAHHDGECDDDPRPDEAPGCCTACNGTGTVETGYPCEDCYATGHCHPGDVSCDGVQADDDPHPDEAQETRDAADWPAEESDRG